MIDLQAGVLGLATLTMILIGVGVTLFTLFLPIIEFVLLFEERSWTAWTLIISMQFFHLCLVWYSTIYGTILRALIWPIRSLIMPVVMAVVRIESMRNRDGILYVDLGDQARDSRGEETIIMTSFRPSVRRRYRKMEALYRRSRIRHEIHRAETSLRLADVVPVMWEHEKRCCERDGRNVIEEFLKRYLVMTLATDAVLDLYYDANEKLVSVQLSLQQGEVHHWFMYFSRDHDSGIWFHGILNAIVRGRRNPNVRYVNAQNHQTQSKKNAGYMEASHDEGGVISNLYPFAMTMDIPLAVLDTGLWSGMQTESPAVSLSTHPVSLQRDELEPLITA